MSEEKRKSTRYDSLNLSYVCEDQNGNILHESMGRTLNISESGILLETPDQNAPGNTVVLQIALEDDLVNIRGQVIHCNPGEKGLFKTGIEFTEIDEESGVILKRYIALFKEQQG
jgi:hypothetical protein